MQEVGVLTALAEIAGVFVGFGALIAVRSGASDAFEVGYMRTVVGMGLLTVVAALAPVTLGGYDLSGHEVWALSSVVVLVGSLGLVAAMARTPEYRANWRAELARTGWRWSDLGGWTLYALYMGVIVLAPIVILLGLFPEQEAALYVTLVVLILLGAGWTLMYLVLAQRRPTASDEAELPAE
jgi:hypothetical protein